MSGSFSRVDTEPGSVSVFAPPEGFNGSDSDYCEWMRERWRQDPGVRQVIAVTGRLLMRGTIEVRFLGPYADEAKRIAKASI